MHRPLFIVLQRFYFELLSGCFEPLPFFPASAPPLSVLAGGQGVWGASISSLEFLVSGLSFPTA